MFEYIGLVLELKYSFVKAKVFVPGTSILKSRPCTSVFRMNRCSVPEFVISMPRTSQNYSISITYAIICLSTTCSATAAEDLRKLL